MSQCLLLLVLLLLLLLLFRPHLPPVSSQSLATSSLVV